MLRLQSRSKWLFAVLCIAVVSLRLTGAHVHLCLDDSEPPAALHLNNDSGLHHLVDAHDAADAPHADQDVEVAADVLLKKSTSGFEWSDVLLVATLLLLLTSTRQTGVRWFFITIPVCTLRAFLRPPLRGPPRFASC